VLLEYGRCRPWSGTTMPWPSCARRHSR